MPVNHAVSYVYNDTLCYWDKYSDTIFRLSQDKILKPLFAFNENGYQKNMKWDVRKKKILSEDPANGGLYIYRFLETTKFFFIKSVFNISVVR